MAKKNHLHQNKTPKNNNESTEKEVLFTVPGKRDTSSVDFAITTKTLDETNEKKMNPEIHLTADGVVLPKEETVIGINFKVGTEFSKKDSKEGEDQVQVIGRKAVGRIPSTKVGLQFMRKRFGFSWKRYGRKISLFILVFGVVGVLIVSFVAAWLIDQYQSARPLSAEERRESGVVYARDGKTILFKLFDEERREIVHLCDPNIPLEKQEGNCIPKNMQLAIIALEDEKFYFNETGIPWSNIAGAAVQCLTSGGDKCRGGSGISQQLVKNLTGDKDPTIDRKIRELFTAIKLNQENPHDKILDTYLNTIPFGRNAYGVQEAAKSYFDKDIKNISTPEACYLAALVQQPTTYSTSIEKRNTEEFDSFGRPWKDHWLKFESRKNICLQKLHDLILIPGEQTPFITTREELESLKQAEVTFTPNRIIFKYPHFTDFVREELKKIIPNERDLYEGGYRIVTTIDPVIQEKVEAAVAARVQSNLFANGANNTSALVLDRNTGEIIAMVGSRDYYAKEIDGQVNIITTPQQPGSSIKPYVYAAALSKGFNPGTIIIDKLTDFGGGYRPTNYGGQTGYGPVTIRYALQNSLNISAVKAAIYAAGQGDYNPAAGINEVFNFSEKVGLVFPCVPSVDGDKCKDPQTAKRAYRDRCSLAAALGGCEVTMLSHATGINTLLNEGNLRTATPFISIESRINPEINESLKQRLADLYPKKDAVIDPLVAKQIANIMSDHSARLVFGPFGANLMLDGWWGVNSVAAKTGTSNDVRDVWTVGGSPYYTVAVWVGNTDNSPMKSDASSANSAGGIWKDIMKVIHEGKQPKGFSTDGLRPYPINCAGTTPGWCRGNELLTDSQIRVIQDGEKKMAAEDFDLLESNIFVFRNEVLSRKVKVSKLDGKLASKNLPEVFIEEVECIMPISGFPKLKNWFEPAKTVDVGSSKCPTEFGDMVSGIQEMSLNTGSLASNANAPTTIFISATPTQPGGSMRYIKLIVGGQEVNSGVNSIALSSESLGLTGIFDVEVIAEDSFGIKISKKFTNVTFLAATSSSISDITSISCTIISGSSPVQASCVITTLPGKSIPSNLFVQVGDKSTLCVTTPCTIDLPSNPGTYTIFAEVGGNQQSFGNITIP